MRHFIRKNWIAALVSASVMTLTAAVTARLLLCHISLFLSFDEQFGAIFAQIRDGALKSPVLVLMAIAFPAAWGLRKMGECKRWRIPAGILWTLLWLLLLISALLLTRVNGIRFGDVLVSLLDILQKGGFDGL